MKAQRLSVIAGQKNMELTRRADMGIGDHEYSDDLLEEVTQCHEMIERLEAANTRLREENARLRDETRSLRAQLPMPKDELVVELCRVVGVEQSAVFSKNRHAATVAARRMIAWCLRVVSGFSTPTISKLVGFRSHASALEALRVGNAVAKAHPELATQAINSVKSIYRGTPATMEDMKILMSLHTAYAQTTTVDGRIATLGCPLPEGLSGFPVSGSSPSSTPEEGR